MNFTFGRLLFLLMITLVASCATALAQTPAPVDQPSLAVPVVGPGMLSVLTDATNVAMVTYSLSQIADSTTDWNVTVRGKEYHVNPLQRTAFAGGTLFGALAVCRYLPKAKPYVTAALVIGTSILAGRAYAHTLTHGTPGAIGPQPAGVAFSVRMR